MLYSPKLLFFYTLAFVFFVIPFYRFSVLNIRPYRSIINRSVNVDFNQESIFSENFVVFIDGLLVIILGCLGVYLLCEEAGLWL
jgi:hypothetical protein